MAVADHVQKVMKPNFAASWEEVGPENELEDTYALSSMSTLEGMLIGEVGCKVAALVAVCQTWFMLSAMFVLEYFGVFENLWV